MQPESSLKPSVDGMAPGPLHMGRRGRPCIVVTWLRSSCLAAACGWLASCTSLPPPGTTMSPHEQVLAAERGFAATMARRDLAAFAGYLDEEAVFFSDPEPLRGKDRIVEGWSRLFKDKDAPFSWEPDEVEVLPSGTLAFSSGPVRAPGGRVVARFNSIWRLQSPGVWKVVFDKGSPLPASPTSP